MNVLVVEDDKRIAHVLKQGLAEDGHSVFLAHRGDEGAELIKSEHFDVVVLDIMLPGLDGMSVLKQVRAHKCAVPILMLTARDSMPDVVRGLDLGADDYLTKPFQLEVLLARVRAVGRRGHTGTTNELKVGRLVMDRSQRIVRHDLREIGLTKKEFVLLELLMRRAGQVVTRSQLIEAGWGYDADVSDNSIDFYIYSLRSKISGEGATSCIRTVRSLGYLLMEPQ
ncbi:MAG: two component transcriptional regulator, winged helix family [Acidobacteriaceae bacterium]|nr:two component transcriptional regulator, winged helix family [Acidobacteriaceae bacterium]